MRSLKANISVADNNSHRHQRPESGVAEPDQQQRADRAAAQSDQRIRQHRPKVFADLGR